MPQPVALITGAGRGIGRGAALELAARGYELLLVSRTESELTETQELAGGGLILPADVARPDDVDRLVATALQHAGRIDALVHCAGLAPVHSIEETTVDEWRAVLDTNLSSAFYLCKALWPIFRRQGGGVVVNISSLASRDPFPGFAAYAAAKAGLNLFSLVAAREGQAIGIRVHTLVLGAVETAMFRQIRSPEQYPADQTLSPREVARVIGQCVQGDLRYTSGEMIVLHKIV